MTTDPVPSNDEEPTSPGSGLAWSVILGLILAGVAAVSWWLGPALEPDLALIAPVNPDCDIKAGPCSDTFPDGSQVRFSITPIGIPLVTPLGLDVRVQGIAPGSVQVDFAGYDMDMGFNRTTLQPTEEPGHYVGSGMIPICVRDHMVWEARVLLETPEGMLAAPFRFDSYRSRDVPK